MSALSSRLALLDGFPTYYHAPSSLYERLTSTDSPLQKKDRTVHAMLQLRELPVTLVFSQLPDNSLCLNLFAGPDGPLDTKPIELVARADVAAVKGHAGHFLFYKCPHSSKHLMHGFYASPSVEVRNVDVAPEWRSMGYGTAVVRELLRFYDYYLCHATTVRFGVRSFVPTVAIKCYRTALKQLGYSQHGPLVCTYAAYKPEVDEYEMTIFNPDEYETDLEGAQAHPWTGEISFIADGAS